MSEVESPRFGNELASYVLLPDYRITANGYGLLQLTANFSTDGSRAGSVGAEFYRGATFPTSSGGPQGGFGHELAQKGWSCINAEESGRDGDIVIVTARYAAIEGDSGKTETEATVTSSAVSEPITSHPNFTRRQVKNLAGEKPIGGEPPVADLVAKPYDKTVNPNFAKWIPSSTGGSSSYQFVDFLPSPNKDDKVNRLAGVRNYMRPSVTVRLTGYTTDAAQAQETVSYVGFQCQGGVGILALPAAYAGLASTKSLELDPSTGAAPGLRNWLITSSNLEVFGGLYKCTIDLMLSGIMGWDNQIYPAIGSNAGNFFGGSNDMGYPIEMPIGGWTPGITNVG